MIQQHTSSFQAAQQACEWKTTITCCEMKKLVVYSVVMFINAILSTYIHMEIVFWIKMRKQMHASILMTNDPLKYDLD